MLAIELPDMSGFDIMNKLRQSKFTKHLPIIYFEKDVPARMGMDTVFPPDYRMQIPVDVDNLKSQVANAIKQA